MPPTPPQAPSPASGTPQGATGPQTSRPAAQREPRISDVTAMLMVGAGILFDLVAAIPIVGGYMAQVFGGGTFLLWFLILSIPLMSPKTVANWGLNLVVGETATAGVWPGFTIGAILTIAMTRAEDKLGIDIMGAVKNPAQVAKIAEQLPGALKNQLVQGATPQPSQTTPAQEPQNSDGLNPVTASQEGFFAEAQGVAPRTLSNGATPPRRTPNQPSNTGTPQTTPRPHNEPFPGTSPLYGRSVLPQQQPVNDNIPQKPPMVDNMRKAS